MATVPLSGTNVNFLSGVPFANDHKHTRWFDSITDQTNYFLSKPIVHSMTQATFQRPEHQNFVKVDKNIDALWGTNYMMFQNANYNNKWFYAFVTRLEYKNSNTTWVHFEIDVLQTWLFDLNFKDSFVVREHCELWNADGTPVINTIDEGLAYGTEYEVVDVENWQPYDGVFFLIIVSKSAMHTAGGVDYSNQILPKLNGLPQALSYYIHPFKLTGTSPAINVGNTVVNLSTIIDTLTNIFKITTAVNDVVSMYVTDHFGYDVTYDSTADVMTFDATTVEGCSITDGTTSVTTLHLTTLPSYDSLITKDFGTKYTNFKTVTESKLLMYPYTLTILDDFKGNRTVLKNEYINNTNLNVTVKGSLGTSNKVSYQVVDYLFNGSVPNDQQQRTHASLEHALINNNPNDTPILSDYLSAYLQGNKNQLENQKTTIAFNGVMGAIGNGIGAVASASTGNVAGFASSSMGMVKGAGDSVLALQAIEAKKADIANMPPQLVKMGSNSAFDFGNGYNGVYVIKKQITDEYITKLTDFFNMFGYKKNEVKQPNFHTRQNWNYVETKACNITGNFNNEDLQELKNVFDSGITLWHTDDVGNYSLANGVI